MKVKKKRVHKELKSSKVDKPLEYSDEGSEDEDRTTYKTSSDDCEI